MEPKSASVWPGVEYDEDPCELVQISEFSEFSVDLPQAVSPSSIIHVYEDDEEEDEVEARLKEVRALVTAPLKGSDTSDERYSRLLHLAKEEDFGELKKMNFLYKTRGFDNAGHTIVVFIEDNLLPYLSVVRPEQVLLYLIHVLDSIVARTYVVMYVPSSTGNPVLFKAHVSPLEKSFVYDSIADYYALFAAAANNIFPPIYGRNIRRFYVFLSKDVSLFWFRMYAGYYFYYTFSSRFWSIVEYVPDLRRIFLYVSPIYFRLPTRIFAQLSGITPVFGIPIASVPTKSDSSGDTQLHSDGEYPSVVFDCLRVLNHSTAYPNILSFKARKDYSSRNCMRGFEDEDFRAALSNLITEYNFSGNPDLGRVRDCAIVANLLRVFLAELPEPLIPGAVVDELVALHGKKELSGERVGELVGGVDPLPRRVVREVLWFLVDVLRNRKYSKANMNDVVNYMFYTMVRGYEFGVVAPVLKFVCVHNEFILK